MNHDTNNDTDNIPPFDNPLHEQEWLAQEHAMRRERLHLDTAGDDARSRHYRLLARALRTDEPEGLPSDFARQMSARVMISSRARAPSMTLERALTVALVVALLLAAGAVTLLYGSSWWPPFKVLLPAPAALQWVFALSGCLGLSWVVGAWSRWSTSAH